MPNYEYRCPACDAGVDVFFSMADRVAGSPHPWCPRCRRPMTAVFGAPAVSGCCFTPYFDQGLGRVVHNVRERDKMANKMDLVPYEG